MAPHGGGGFGGGGGGHGFGGGGGGFHGGGHHGFHGGTWDLTIYLRILQQNFLLLPLHLLLSTWLIDFHPRTHSYFCPSFAFFFCCHLRDIYHSDYVMLTIIMFMTYCRASWRTSCRPWSTRSSRTTWWSWSWTLGRSSPWMAWLVDSCYFCSFTYNPNLISLLIVSLYSHPTLHPHSHRRLHALCSTILSSNPYLTLSITLSYWTYVIYMWCDVMY